MKCFMAIEEDLLQKLWMRNPQLVVPFSRPFFPSEPKAACQEVNREVQSLLARTNKHPSLAPTRQ